MSAQTDAKKKLQTAQTSASTALARAKEAAALLAPTQSAGRPDTAAAVVELIEAGARLTKAIATVLTTVPVPPPVVVPPVPPPVPTPVPVPGTVRIKVPPIAASDYSVWVQVFGSATFDTSKIDPTDLILGDGGTKAVPVSQYEYGQNFDNDGFPDAHFSFSVPGLIALGLPLGGQLVIRGTNTATGPFVGTVDPLAPVPPVIPPIIVNPPDGGIWPAPWPVIVVPGIPPGEEPPPPVPVPPAPGGSFVDLSASGPHGIKGPKFEAVAGLLTVQGDGVTSTAVQPWPLYDANYLANGLYLGAAAPLPGSFGVGAYPPGYSGDNWIDGPSPGYYDKGLCLGKLWLRTGNTTVRDNFRNWTDTWYKGKYIAEGTQPMDTAHDPRHVALQGLMLRAIDGRPDVWDWIYRYTNFHFAQWIEGKHANSLLHNEMENAYRPTGYMLLYTAILSRVLPDSYPLVAGGTATDGAAKRANLLARLEYETSTLVLPIQQSDGTWRWTSPDDNVWRTQPMIFMGLWIEGIIETYFASSNAPLKTAIVTALDKFANHAFTSVYRPNDEWRNSSCVPTGRKFRSVWYMYGGGTTGNHSEYATGGQSPPHLACWNDQNSVREQRQIGMPWLVMVFGFLYQVTGDLIWKVRGDEWMASMFGKGVGPGADSSYCLCDFTYIGSSPGGRNFNQAYRSSTKYLAWRLGS